MHNIIILLLATTGLVITLISEKIYVTDNDSNFKSIPLLLVIIIFFLINTLSCINQITDT